MRDEFEEWYRAHLGGNTHWYTGDLRYADGLTQEHWLTWQAGAEAMRERAANVAEMADDPDHAYRLIRALPID